MYTVTVEYHAPFHHPDYPRQVERYLFCTQAAARRWALWVNLFYVGAEAGVTEGAELCDPYKVRLNRHQTNIRYPLAASCFPTSYECVEED